jgi:hypothetical protein
VVTEFVKKLDTKTTCKVKKGDRSEGKPGQFYIRRLALEKAEGLERKNELNFDTENYETERKMLESSRTEIPQSTLISTKNPKLQIEKSHNVSSSRGFLRKYPVFNEEIDPQEKSKISGGREQMED